MKLSSVKESLLKHRYRTAILCFLLMFLSFTLASPVKTVKGLLVDTGIAPFNAFFSIDAGRVAFQTSNGNDEVYDFSAGSGTSFAPPPNENFPPQIFGDRVVVVGNATNIGAPTTLFYCNLPHTSPPQACGPWIPTVQGLPSIATLAFFGSFPQFRGDLVVWSVSNGFSFYRFSTNTVTTVTTTTQTHGPQSNGQIITFTAKPSPTSSSQTVMYYDTTSRSPSVVDTSLPGYSQSISQYTIAFVDNSTSTDRIRYYDILRNLSSPAGTGPIGVLLYATSPAIWGDRIVFQIDEASANFDCNGDGTISSGESCLGYWNIRAPSYVATTIDYSASPGIKSFPAIYDKTIVFQGSNGNVQWVTVPMKGDVNLDGKVDGVDKMIVVSCLGQALKGSSC